MMAAELEKTTSAAQAAKILISAWRRREWTGPAVEVLQGRDPAWLADVARRLAAKVPLRRPADWPVGNLHSTDLYQAARALVFMSGHDAPADDAFVLEWAMVKWRRERERTLADVLRPSRRYHEEESAAEGFRADPHTAAFLPQVFGLVGFGTFLLHPYHWRADLLALTETGELDRRTLLDLCVGGLLRGGRATEPRGFWTLLEEAKPTGDELADHVHDWAALAGRSDPPVAGRAIEMLRTLLDAGRLESGVLAEATRDVLSRPEKSLVRAQLKLAGEALRRTPGDADELLPAVAVAFGHEDSVVQEQAWKLVARHLKTIDGPARAELAEALPQLAPDLRERAAAALGEQPATTEQAEDVLPPVSSPGRTAEAPGSPVELAQEVAALLGGKLATPLDRERVVDGLIRQSYRDRAGLAAVLEPVVRRQPWLPDGLGDLLRAVLGEVKVDEVPLAPPDMAGRHDHARCLACVCDHLWEARLYEAARRLLTEPVPFLLATPGWTTGAVDADVLVERLAEYTKLGLRAGNADLDQALLRVRPPEAPEPGARAAALGTPDGDRLARWLDSGGVQAGFDPAAGTELPALREGFTAAFRNLDGRLTTGWHFTHKGKPAPLPHWVATVPVFREYLAEQVEPDGKYQTLLEFFPDLPLLIEADGAAGPRLNEVVACGLATAERAQWPGVLDAMLQLAARGELDVRSCGELLGRWGNWNDEPHDFAPILGEAARAGAYRIVWGLLHAALPGLLARERRPRKLSAVLTLAADCASHTGATGDVPGLDALAESKSSSQAVKQARRLRAGLAANAS